MNTPTPQQGNVQERKAFIIAIVFLVAILANLILSLSLGFQSGEWQQFARAGVVLAFGAVTIAAVFQIRRGRAELGIHLILGGFLGALFGTELLLAGFGLVLGLIEILIASLVVTQTLPSAKAGRLIGVTVIVAFITFGLDYLPLTYRVPAPTAFTRALPVIAGAVVLLFMGLAIWQVFRGNSIRNKILVPTITIAAVILSGIFAVQALQTNRNITAEENNRLLNSYQIFNDRISLLTDFSVALATEVANNVEIQKAFANQDRERLTELTLPSYLVIDQEYDIPQYQFHLPPATSFLRLHQLDQYGDDLSAFRFTVLAANDGKKPVGGVEIGRGGLGVRGVVPVSYQGKHIGTVEFGLNINQTLLNELKTNYGDEWQLLLLKEPAAIGTFVSTRTDVVPPRSDLVFQAGTRETPIFSSPDGYGKALKGENNIETISIGGGSYTVLSAPLYDFSGNIIGVVDIISDQTVIAQQQRQQVTLLIVVLLVTLLILGAAVYFLVTRILEPINSLTKSSRAIADGDLNQVVLVKSQDELGMLAQTFNQMAAELKNLFTTLEQRVAARTRDLATVAEVGTATATILEIDNLLLEVVNLTKERFNLYHSHIYLLDGKGENLVLTAGAGEPGRIMATEKRSIPLGREQSLVARAAREQKGVIVNDVTQAPDFLPNPLLPDTRSELAVPMIVGGKVIGVFDVQSDQVGRFTDADINIQTTLAAQVSTSIQNVRSFEQSKAQADLESLVNAIGQKIQRATTVEDTLQTAIREIGTALGASRVTASIGQRPNGENAPGND